MKEKERKKAYYGPIRGLPSKLSPHPPLVSSPCCHHHPLLPLGLLMEWCWGVRGTSDGGRWWCPHDPPYEQRLTGMGGCVVGFCMGLRG